MRVTLDLLLICLLFCGCRTPRIVSNSWNSFRHSKPVEGLIGSAKELESEVDQDLARGADRADDAGNSLSSAFDKASDKTEEVAEETKSLLKSDS